LAQNLGNGQLLALTAKPTIRRTPIIPANAHAEIQEVLQRTGCAGVMRLNATIAQIWTTEKIEQTLIVKNTQTLLIWFRTTQRIACIVRLAMEKPPIGT
jgi:hypothetical protein